MRGYKQRCQAGSEADEGCRDSSGPLKKCLDTNKHVSPPSKCLKVDENRSLGGEDGKKLKNLLEFLCAYSGGGVTKMCLIGITKISSFPFVLSILLS